MSEFSRVFDEPMPDGWKIYERAAPVRGVYHRASVAAAFVRGKEQRLKFRIVADGEQYAGAMEVVGLWRGLFFRKERLLGYVAAEVNADLAALALQGAVRPRLLRAYFDGASDVIRITYQVIGPVRGYKSYLSLRKNREQVQRARKSRDDAGGDDDRD